MWLSANPNILRSLNTQEPTRLDQIASHFAWSIIHNQITLSLSLTLRNSWAEGIFHLSGFQPSGSTLWKRSARRNHRRSQRSRLERKRNLLPSQTYHQLFAGARWVGMENSWIHFHFLTHSFHQTSSIGERRAVSTQSIKIRSQFMYCRGVSRSFERKQWHETRHRRRKSRKGFAHLRQRKFLPASLLPLASSGAMLPLSLFP